MVKIAVDKTGTDSYYLQIQKQIRNAVREGKLKPGDKLPPLRKWAPLLGVNLHTLNRALTELVREGILCRRCNHGTFIKGEPSQSPKKDTRKPQSTLKVILPDREKLDYPYTQEVLRGINLRAATYGLGVELKCFPKESEQPRFWKEVLETNNTAGLILDKEGFPNRDAIRLIENCRKEIVLFNSNLATHREVPSVIIDNEKGAYLAAEHLIKKGHKKIALFLRSESISAPFSAYYTDVFKLQGFKIAMQKYELEVEPGYLKEGLYGDPGKIKKAVEEILGLANPATAIISADDLIASEVLKVLKEKSVRIPEDISLVGFNNFVHSQLGQPGLTTVETPMCEMGQKAVDLLFTNTEPRHPVLNVSLIERNSVSTNNS